MEEILRKYNESIVDTGKLKKEVKKTLQDYERSLKEAKRPTREEEEEGWTKVHHKGGRDSSKKHAAKMKKKKNKNESEKLLNFYAFEVRESKLKKHKELLEKFEEDKKRLAKMREQRKFKVT